MSSTYTSFATLMADIVSVLTAAGFVNDCLPDTSPAPNRPVFRVGIESIEPSEDTLGNNEKSCAKGRIQVAYLHPISGGNPQQSEYDVASAVESLLDALATTSDLDSGTAITFTGCQIRNITPTFNRADLDFEAVINIP